MRATFTLLAVVFQFLVLVYMAGNREYILNFGELVYLRTAPIDPRDVFRGDFVRLDFELSSVDRSVGEFSSSALKKGQKVYAVLNPIAGDLYGLTKLTDKEPGQGLVMRGRVRYGYVSNTVHVKYGIEQLFVEQGAGLDIEKRRGNRQSLQIPMEVAVALSANGTAVVKDFRWSKLGMQLEVIRQPAPRDRNVDPDEVEGPLSPKLKLTLKNGSDSAFGLVNPGDNCGFELVPVLGSPNEFESADQSCVNVVGIDDDVVLLAPEEELIIEVDLSETRWHVRLGDEVDEMGRLSDWDRFRLVYRSPGPGVIGKLSDGERVWVGYLPSRAFRASGQID